MKLVVYSKSSGTQRPFGVPCGAMRLRPVPPFRYMQWAKEHASAARFHLGSSGLSPPTAPPALAPFERGDLLQRGPHMPPEARRRVAERLGVAEGELLLTLGTSHAMYLLCAALLEPGDLCLVERPAYEMLATLPVLFGATVERFDRDPAARWRPPAGLPERIRAARPKLVILTNPHNPTGALLHRDELAPIAAAAAEVDAVLAVDEVYLEYLAEPMAHTAFGLPSPSGAPCVATCSSLTKAYGFGAARFGWLLAPPALIDAAIRYNDYVAVLYPNPSAEVGLAALDRIAELQARAARVRAERFPVVEGWIAGRSDVSWVPPEAGVVGLVRLERVTDTPAFCARLLAERDTLLVPGDFFEAPGHVRLGFGIDQEILAEGLARVGAALDALG
jgi:aspartate/methionine/tyrosine aminotransferase